MNQDEKDLRTFYYALPDWAKKEIAALADRVEDGQLGPREYVAGLEDLLRRVELEKDGKPRYLH